MKITDEMRDQMLFRVNVLGVSAADVGQELGCSGRTVAKTRDVFEAVRDKDWEALRGMYSVGKLGLNTLRWAESRTRVEVPATLRHELGEMQQKLKAKYEAPKEEEPQKPEPVAAPEATPTGPKMHIPAASAETGWQTRIKVAPDRLCMMVYFNGVLVEEGWSRVKGNKELGLMQAISYAAHMVYKNAEQRKLGGR